MLHFIHLRSAVQPTRHVPQALKVILGVFGRAAASRIVYTAPRSFGGAGASMSAVIAVESDARPQVMEAALREISDRLGRGPASGERRYELTLIASAGGRERFDAAGCSVSPWVRPAFLELTRFLGLTAPAPRARVRAEVAVELDGRRVGAAPAMLRSVERAARVAA